MLISFLNLIVMMVIFGVAMWFINAFLPMPPAIKGLLNIVVLVVLVLYVLQFFGLISPILPVWHLFK